MNIAITGASRGIGQATAKRFNTPENSLYLMASDQKSFQEPLPGVTTVTGDMQRPEEIQRISKELSSQVGSLDVLFNNVGVMVMKKFEDMSFDDINHLLDLNLRSHLLLTQQLLPLLEKGNNPQIIFMSSMAAKTSIVGESVYSATKSAITSFANVLRNELNGRVRVTAIHAWGVNTWGADDAATLMKPENIADVVEFVVTRPSSMMVESIDLSHPSQWRGSQAPWSPK